MAADLEFPRQSPSVLRWLLVLLLWIGAGVKAQEAPHIQIHTPISFPPIDYTVSYSVIPVTVDAHGQDFRCAMFVDGRLIQVASPLENLSPITYADALYGLKPGVSHTAFMRVRTASGSYDSLPVTFTTPPAPIGSPEVSITPTDNPSEILINVNPHGRAAYVEICAFKYFGSELGIVSGSQTTSLRYTIPSNTGPLSYLRVRYVDQSDAAISGGLFSPWGDGREFGDLVEPKWPTPTPKGAPPALYEVTAWPFGNNGVGIYGRLDDWGADVYLEFFVNGKSVGKQLHHANTGNKVGGLAFDLKSGTDYVVSCRAWNAYGTSSSPEIAVHTAGTPPPGNKPPVASIAVLRIAPEDSNVTGTINASDPEGKAVTVQSYTQGALGQVAVNGFEVTYTPGPYFQGSDQFYIVLADDQGATSSLTAQAIAAGADQDSGTYDLTVRFNTDPPKPAGTLTLKKTSAGSFTGKLVIYGAEYSLLGSFNSEGVALLDLDRLGLPPLLVTLTTSSRVESERYLYVTIDAAELAAIYVAEGAPVGDAETNAGLTGLQYTAALPMRAAESATPQGDGFVTGRVTRKGQVRFAGQTGDGQPFTIGGRLQRTHRLQFGISVGKSPRDYLQGSFDFSKDLNKTVRGEVSWLSYRKTTEHYTKNFTRTLQPMGAQYRADLGLFGEVAGTDTAKVHVIGDDAVLVGERDLSFKRARTTFSARDPQFALKVTRGSGLFRGTFETAGGAKLRMNGVLVQAFDRGAGSVDIGGAKGAVEILPP